MRNPDRIDPFIWELRKLWHEYPDMRFGQLVMNLSRDPTGGFHDAWEWDTAAFRRRINEFRDTYSA